MSTQRISHYKWLDLYFMVFVQALRDTEGHKLAAASDGLIVAHGDKCYGYRRDWEDAGIAFPHGVAIYLLSYCYPFTKDVRETAIGWVDPKQWVIDVYPKFKDKLPVIDENDKSLWGFHAR